MWNISSLESSSYECTWWGGLFLRCQTFYLFVFWTKSILSPLKCNLTGFWKLSSEWQRITYLVPLQRCRRMVLSQVGCLQLDGLEISIQFLLWVADHFAIQCQGSSGPLWPPPSPDTECLLLPFLLLHWKKPNTCSTILWSRLLKSQTLKLNNKCSAHFQSSGEGSV